MPSSRVHSALVRELRTAMESVFVSVRCPECRCEGQATKGGQMRRFHSARSFAIFGLVTFLGLFLFPWRASADGVTFTGQTNIALTEDGTRPIFFYTLTNNSGATLSGINPFIAAVFSGDESDVPPTAYGGRVPGSTCTDLGSLATGNSCTIGL